MSVSGFGANSGEIKEQKVIPDKLITYRMFRFAPQLNSNPKHSWGSFAREPSRGGWSPTLTPASYNMLGYDRPGVYTAMCQRTKGPQFSYSNYRVRLMDDVYVGEGAHRAPEKTCTCGFWAYYTPEVVDTGNSMEWMALAAVNVWGDVVLGDKGVRAEMMEIVGLQIPQELHDADAAIVDAWIGLCAKLQVPYYWAKSELVKFHPPQDVSELIPKQPPPPEYSYEFAYERLQLLREALNQQQTYQSIPAAQRQWLYTSPSLQTYTTNTTNPTAPTLPVYVPPPVTFKEVCCVCGFTINTHDKGLAEKTLAEHILGVHPEM